MSFRVERTDAAGWRPIWQTMLETAQGGFTLSNATGLADGFVLKGGTAMDYDEATRIATPQIGVMLQANATNVATTYQVPKNSGLAVGDSVFAVDGGVADAITAIDTSNAAYDVITVGTTLGVALSAGDSLYVAAAEGATAGGFQIVPKGLLYEDYVVGSDINVAIVIRGTVYARRIPAGGAGLEAALPLIRFSQSY